MIDEGTELPEFFSRKAVRSPLAEGNSSRTTQGLFFLEQLLTSDPVAPAWRSID
jgi:hypothetical protein